MRTWRSMDWRAAIVLAACYTLFIVLGFVAVPAWIVELATVGMTVSPALRASLERDVSGFLVWAMTAVTCVLIVYIGYQARPSARQYGRTPGSIRDATPADSRMQGVGCGPGEE